VPPEVEAAPERRGEPSSPFIEPHATPEEVAALPASLRLRYAAWLRVRGHADAAARVLDVIEQLSGETATLLDERAALALFRGDAAAVRAFFARRLANRPSPSAHVALARALMELGDINEANAIVSELTAEHGEMATVQALAADLAMFQGDLGTAHDYASAQLAEDNTRIAPRLALARIALFSGDLGDARAALDRALSDPDTLTAAQVASAAGLAELLAQPARAQSLRMRFARLETERTAALAMEIDEALGREKVPQPNGRDVDAPQSVSQPQRLHSSVARAPSEPESEPESDTHHPTPITEEEPIADERVLSTLHDVFGHESLRPGQAAVINRVLAGRDTLAILPTGAGKSLTFQLASLLLPGTTLVLSPLIALMKDQVEAMPPALRQRTVLINSTLSPAEQQLATETIASGAAKLVYAAPERLRQHGFLRALRQGNVSLVVVDEAHCISLWGHDFRPDYLTIPAALPELGDPSLLAVTATATPRMETGIAAGFDRELDRVRTSVFRPNLRYEVHRLSGREEKVKKVLEIAREDKGAGIVYVSSRKDAEAIAALLRDRGVSAVPYHAGLDPDTRAGNQERFMRGQARVVVATVAFGMGVDKRDVRFIVHLNPPRSLEAYAQESGRAGRDGLPARCVLLIAPADQASLNRLARRDEQDIDTLRRLYMAVKQTARGRWAIVDPNALLPPPAYDDDPDDEPDPRIGLGLLDQARLLRRHPDAPVTYSLHRQDATGNAPATDTVTDADPPFAALAAWSGLNERGSATFRTAEACDHLDLSPLDLGRLLASQPDISFSEGPRLVCLELLPAGTDAGTRLNDILARARREAKARIQQVITYATGTRCRHAVLASHLGESLEPCGDSCDICLGEVAPDLRGKSAASDTATTCTRLTPADALAVLNAVRTLPFGMGKTGLARLLLGSVESRVRPDRSASFGALSAFKKGMVEGLIDRLVDDGFLFRDLDHEYKLIRLTERGAAATLDDLGAYAEEQSASDAADLSSDDQVVFMRLRDWRLDRASRDGVAPFVIAHNTSLVEIAQRRPKTLEDLASIKGFGANRTEKYGPEIMTVLRTATDGQAST
jgi:ATP-dependent DNA helicase RecQ